MTLKSGSLSVAVTAFMIIMFLVSASVLLKNYILVDWERAEARITSSDISSRHVRVKQSSSRVYRICVTYVYYVEGVEYQGNDCSVLSEFSDRDDAELAKSNFQRESDGLIDIQYNINDPRESIAVTENRFKSLWLLFGVSASFLLFQIVKWRRAHKYK